MMQRVRFVRSLESDKKQEAEVIKTVALINCVQFVSSVTSVGLSVKTSL